MTGFNLPPGVNVNDIPGNRPEDMIEEAFWMEIDKEFTKRYGEKGKMWLTMNEDIDPEDMIWEYVRLACELAAIQAVNEYRADEELSRSYEEERMDLINAQNYQYYLERL